MNELTFVTGNNDKYTIAAEIFQSSGLNLIQSKLDIEEIQSENTTAIAVRKAQDAYQILQKPLIVRDDNWSLPALNGFPEPYMKSINHWFSPEDFLRLMNGQKDRRAILTQTLVYKDARIEKLMTHVTSAVILNEPRGKTGASFEKIVSMNGDNNMSVSEIMESGRLHSSRAPAAFWHDFIHWYKENVL